MVGFFFQDLVLVHVEISQVKRFDTFMNCYRDDSRPYVSSITQFSVLDCRPDGHTLPPLGNFADIPYLKEQSFLHRIRDVCTL